MGGDILHLCHQARRMAHTFRTLLRHASCAPFGHGILQPPRIFRRKEQPPMIVPTTNSVDGYRVSGYYGIVFGEVITGINFLRDLGAGIRNLVGGRSEGYEQELMQARTEALQELEQRAASLGAHAVIGVDMDYEVLGQGNMLMVTASGTAVTLEQAVPRRAARASRGGRPARKGASARGRRRDPARCGRPRRIPARRARTASRDRAPCWRRSRARAGV